MILDALAQPIVQAPMAGGTSTPAMAAGTSAAGGLGFVAAGYRSAQAMMADVHAVREATSAPFGVNLFVPGAAAVDEQAVSAYADRLAPEAARRGVTLGEPRADEDGWRDKLELLRADPVPVVSFTFGCPDPVVVRSLKAAGSEVWVTVTDVAEARQAVEAGADVLVLQGVEAGGHRGSWADPDGAEGLGILPLLRLAAAETDRPLVAAGGLTDGPAIAAVLAAGASAAQLGTAFLDCDEAGTHPAHRDRLRQERATALTRSFTGRTARALTNAFLEEHSAGAPTAYPQVHFLTAPLRAAAREAGDAEGFNLWAGQAHRLTPRGSAGEIVEALGASARDALATAVTRWAR